MAGTFSLNTASHPTLTQVLVSLHDGSLFDYKAQQVAGNVNLTADTRKQAAVRSITGPGGVKVLNEA